MSKESSSLASHQVKSLEKNRWLVRETLIELRRQGVEDLCLCPGGRNAPFVSASEVAGFPFRVWTFFDERSAAFFALGKAVKLEKPVAIVTTSGTAAGELLPAMMEAKLAGVPLVAVTADRPRAYRGTAAPQTAEQVGIFGVYSDPTFDIEFPEEFVNAPRIGCSPTHWNLCFDEPLIDQALIEDQEFWRPLVQSLPEEQHPITDLQQDLPIEPKESFSFFQKSSFPIAIVSTLQPRESEAVLKLLKSWEIPTYFEGLSQLRESPEVSEFQLRQSDQLIEEARLQGYPADGVIRIGGVPTLRFWRDLELKYKSIPVLSLSRLSYSGLARESVLMSGDLFQICRSLKRSDPISKEQVRQKSQKLLSQQKEKDRKIQALFEELPRAEPSLVHFLSKQIEDSSFVYLGNSLPIREWDFAAQYEPKRGRLTRASRGLNGIDGQVSAFLGECESDRPNWGVFGDLTTLYDFNGFWPLPQLGVQNISIVVINNGGGKIFERLFTSQRFQNNHTFSFEKIAEQWRVQYEKWEEIPSHIASAVEPRVIELSPCPEQTREFWSRKKKL